jgi:hypothetical protein
VTPMSDTAPETTATPAGNGGTQAAVRKVGPITVVANAAEVAAFRRETGGDADETGVPFTFPVRWFTHPDIRVAGAGMMDAAPWVPIHESQNFDYERPLVVDKAYQMRVELIREREPSRLILRIEVSDSAPCLRAEMILRIIPMQSADSPT